MMDGRFEKACARVEAALEKQQEERQEVIVSFVTFEEEEGFLRCQRVSPPYMAIPSFSIMIRHARHPLSANQPQVDFKNGWYWFGLIKSRLAKSI